MKLYDKVKNLLTDFPEFRDSDKKLFIRIMFESGTLENHGNIISFDRDRFMSSPSFESYRRCRQMVQANNPELRSSKYIQEQKDKVERQRGTFVFRQQLSF